MSLTSILRAAQHRSRLACRQKVQLLAVACLHTERRGSTRSACTQELAQATSSCDQIRKASSFGWLVKLQRKAWL